MGPQRSQYSTRILKNSVQTKKLHPLSTYNIKERNPKTPNMGTIPRNPPRSKEKQTSRTRQHPI